TGANRATDLYLTLTTDPSAANSPMVCGTPSSTLSTCTFLTPQQAINLFSNVSAATNEYVLTKDTATGNAVWKAATAGGGTITGPGSSTNNGLVRWNGTAGTSVKDTPSGTSFLDDGTLAVNALVVPHVSINDTVVGIA